MRNLLIIIGVGVLFLTSCGPRPYYEEYVQIPESGWNSDSSVAFQVNIKDTSVAYSVFLNLRSNSKYPYRNIYLFRNIESSRGIEFKDTAEYFLADPYGKWLGEGIGELKTHHLGYSTKALRFRKTGNYTFLVEHAMRTNKLVGIEDIGLSIFKSQTED